MKYVIFKAGSLLLPVIAPEPVVHSMIKIEGDNEGSYATPDSAGFFHLDKYGHVVIDESRDSTSLKLSPKPDRDQILLTKVFNEVDSTMAYFDAEHDW